MIAIYRTSLLKSTRAYMRESDVLYEIMVWVVFVYKHMCLCGTPGRQRTARLEFLEFLRTFLAGKLKIRTNLERRSSTAHSSVKRMHCTAFMTADKNVNRMESRKLRTTQAVMLDPTFFGAQEYCSHMISFFFLNSCNLFLYAVSVDQKSFWYLKFTSGVLFSITSTCL